ncbi:FecCD family ABC transporter permease [Bacillus sp. FJAT-27916]|uniref:FecCD family ABC transporter permease n=1 Tax=Bacillus sp. FJAT-27916 TaxID=1679169 RepID=UPI00069FD3F5|nr:iron ABC transporter permease [Bacillus sp. FJAT-27916]
MSLVTVLAVILLAVVLMVSLMIGTKLYGLSTIWEALFHRAQNNITHDIIWDIRLPRAIAAALVGAFLAVSGAVMQALTRNVLAEPSLLGVSNGAAFALVLVLTIFPGLSKLETMFASMAGAGLAVLFVFSLSILAKGGITPVKLALAGMATGMFLSSLTTSIALYFDVSKNISFWYAGDLSTSSWTDVKLLLIMGTVGLFIAFSISRALTLLSLGEEITKSLGVHIGLVRTMGVIAVLMLTGSAVAVSGTVGFVGLVIPHITRMAIGGKYGKLLPVAALLGSTLLVGADAISRTINAPYETPIGVLTAVIGVPFFLYMVRQNGRRLFS